jgi:hypothetical protein
LFSRKKRGLFYYPVAFLLPFTGFATVNNGAKNRPVWLSALAAICSGVPVATIRPPPSPPSGPKSIT